jgi:type II secretory ATPase GspE/PulE/Tfp pilus assembly ATPase PilB-like protein
MTFRGASLEELRGHASSSGALQHLIVDGAMKVLDGTTSVTEVLRVTRLASGA